MPEADSPYLQANQAAQYKAAVEGNQRLYGQDWGWLTAAAPAPVKPPETSWYPAMMIRGLARGIDQLGAGMGGTVRYAGQVLDSDALRQIGEGIVSMYEKRAELNPPQTSGDLWSSPSMGRYVSERVAEAVPGFAAFLLPGLVTNKIAVAGKAVGWSVDALNKLAWIGSKVGSPAMFGAMDLGSTYNEAKARGATDEEAVTFATQMGLASAALGAINLHYILGEAGGALTRFARGAVSASIINFLQGGTRAAVLGDDVLDALKETANSVPAMAILGGGAAVTLGGGPAKPREVSAPATPGAPKAPEAPKPTGGLVEPTPSDLAIRQNEARAAELATVKLAGKPIIGKKAALDLVEANPNLSMDELIRLAGGFGAAPEAPAAPAAESPPTSPQVPPSPPEAPPGGPPPTEPPTAPPGAPEGQAPPAAPAPPSAEGPKAPTETGMTSEESAGQQEISARLRAAVARESEFDYQSKKQQLLMAPSSGKTEAVSNIDIDTARRILSDLNAAPGDDPAARKALIGKFPELAQAPDWAPGFKPSDLPGGAEGPVAAIADRLERDLTAQLGRVRQKRGIVGEAAIESGAQKILQRRDLTARDLVNWTPGRNFASPEEALAAKDLASVMLLNGNDMVDASAKGELPKADAAHAWYIAIRAWQNYSAAASEWGRTGKVLQMPGEPAALTRVAELQGIPPIAGGVDLQANIQKIIDTAGGPELAVDQILSMRTDAQRREFGSLTSRLGRAGMELAFASWLGLRTSAKIMLSGPITAGYDIAVTGTVETGKRLLNAIAPDKVDMVRGIQDGETWAKVQGLVAGLSDAFQGIKATWDATARVAKAEGWVKAEQTFIQAVQAAYPEWAVATAKWRFARRMTADQFPEAGDFFGGLIDRIGAVARYTTDAVTAAHGFGYTVNDRVGAYESAFKIASWEGKTGDALTARVQELVRDRPAEVDDWAMRTAKENTFIDDFQGSIGKLVAAGSNSMVKLAGFPFLKIPLKIAEYTLEGTPIIQNLMRGWQRDAFGLDPVRRDMAWGKVAVGWAGMTVLAAMAGNGYLTGSPSRNPMMREIEKAKGIQPLSFKLPGMDTWTSYTGMEPLSGWLAIAADTNEILKHTPAEGMTDYLWPLLVASADEFSSKPFMQGLSNWITFLSDPDPNKKIDALKQAITPPLPMQSTLDPLRRYADDVRREARTFVDRYLNRVPGMSADLAPMRNIITGEPLKYEGAWGPDFLSPFATMDEKPSPVLEELARLRGAGLSRLPRQFGGAAPPSYITWQPGLQPPGVPLTDAQHDRLEVLMTQVVRPGGKTLENAMRGTIETPLYASQSDLTKQSVLQSIWNDYRLAAERQLLAEDKGLAAQVGAVYQERQVRRMPTAQQPAARMRQPAVVPVVAQ